MINSRNSIRSDKSCDFECEVIPDDDGQSHQSINSANSGSEVSQHNLRAELADGTRAASSDLPHPYFDQFVISGYIQQLYNLFKKTNDNDDKDIASLSIGRLFRTKEILDINMRKEIIEHLKTLLDDKDEWNQTAAKEILKDLQINQVNKSEIEKDGFKLPI
ncbi:MAG: hypothetical protein EZS28_000585 [Streblomastix strix]|uniref:Uncharacterized protein n=1 Tax=Streblomastix strix TaxID=222440 RepID=A0A5J4X9D2_9EUKA|nr:MAG: hypothetical protein EZS28_000585 [Streblomastix strix]